VTRSWLGRGERSGSTPRWRRYGVYVQKRTIVVGPLQMTVNRLCYDSSAGMDFATRQYGDRGFGPGLSTKVGTDGYGSGEEFLASRCGKRVKFVARSE
jgi:hypothetical protein